MPLILFKAEAKMTELVSWNEPCRQLVYNCNKGINRSLAGMTN